MDFLRATLLGGLVLAAAGCAPTEVPFRALRKPVAVAAPVCADFQVSIYFERDSAELTREARMVLSDAKVQARDCAVRSVRVVGLADAVGTSEVNLALSRRRAESVSRALAQVGFARADVDLAAVGDTGAVVGSGAAAPLRRRADILVEIEPR